MAEKLSDDVLLVRTYPDRVLVDLRSEVGDDFISIDKDGLILHVGPERLRLEWDALKQLVDVIGVAEVTFRVKTPKRSR